MEISLAAIMAFTLSFVPVHFREELDSVVFAVY